MSSKFASLIIGVMVLVGGALYLILNDTVNQTRNSEWKTYQNEAYNFEIKYPEGWSIYENNSIEPMFSIYTGDPSFPLSHHSNATHVSVFPKGLGTEGVMSQNKELENNPTKERSEHNMEYLLKDGTPWAIGAFGFADIPESWEPFGFIWGASEVKNFKSACVREGEEIKPENCDVFGGSDVIELSGSIDADNWKTVKEILASFTFTKRSENAQVCAQVITSARNPKTGEVKDFPTPCDVPEGWTRVENDVPTQDAVFPFDGDTSIPQ